MLLLVFDAVSRFLFLPSFSFFLLPASHHRHCCHRRATRHRSLLGCRGGWFRRTKTQIEKWVRQHNLTFKGILKIKLFFFDHFFGFHCRCCCCCFRCNWCQCWLLWWCLTNIFEAFDCRFWRGWGICQPSWHVLSSFWVIWGVNSDGISIDRS